jgi:hypothetical protein
MSQPGESSPVALMGMIRELETQRNVLASRAAHLAGELETERETVRHLREELASTARPDVPSES